MEWRYNHRIHREDTPVAQDTPPAESQARIDGDAWQRRPWATVNHEFFLTARSGQTLPDFTESGTPYGLLAAGVRY